MNPLENCLKELSDIRAASAGVTETFYYGPLANFLKQIGKNLKPKVHFVKNTKQFDGIPVKGLCTSDQSQKTTVTDPLSGSVFSRGVIIVKPTSEDARLLTEKPQRAGYLGLASFDCPNGPAGLINFFPRYKPCTRHCGQREEKRGENREL